MHPEVLNLKHFRPSSISSDYMCMIITLHTGTDIEISYLVSRPDVYRLSINPPELRREIVPWGVFENLTWEEVNSKIIHIESLAGNLNSWTI